MSTNSEGTSAFLGCSTMAELLEARGELCVCYDSREESAEKEEADVASGFHVQPEGLTEKQKPPLSPSERERQKRLERTGWNITNGKTTRKGGGISRLANE